MQTVTRIKCGQCKGYHDSVSLVKECHRAANEKASSSPATGLSGLFQGKQPKRFSKGPMTEKQEAFLNSLVRDRATMLPGGEFDCTKSTFDSIGQEAWNVVLSGLDKGLAGDLISKLMKFPVLVKKAKKASSVPSGYYAIPSRTGNNDLDFFVVQEGKNRWEGWTFVRRVVGGHPDLLVRRGEQEAVLKAIEKAGILESSRLYGTEIGRCGRCNRHLTDEESRGRGFGPDCYGKL